MATLSDAGQVYPARYDVALVLDLTTTAGATFTRDVPRILPTLFAAATAESTGFTGLKMMIGAADGDLLGR